MLFYPPEQEEVPEDVQSAMMRCFGAGGLVCRDKGIDLVCAPAPGTSSSSSETTRGVEMVRTFHSLYELPPGKVFLVPLEEEEGDGEKEERAENGEQRFLLVCRKQGREMSAIFGTVPTPQPQSQQQHHQQDEDDESGSGSFCLGACSASLERAGSKRPATVQFQIQSLEGERFVGTYSVVASLHETGVPPDVAALFASSVAGRLVLTNYRLLFVPTQRPCTVTFAPGAGDVLRCNSGGTLAAPTIAGAVINDYNGNPGGGPDALAGDEQQGGQQQPVVVAPAEYPEGKTGAGAEARQGPLSSAPLRGRNGCAGESPLARGPVWFPLWLVASLTKVAQGSSSSFLGQIFFGGGRSDALANGFEVTVSPYYPSSLFASLRLVFRSAQECDHAVCAVVGAAAPRSFGDTFAAHFLCSPEDVGPHRCRACESQFTIYPVEEEFGRQGVDFVSGRGAWRVCDTLNRSYEFCATYPKRFVVPARATDELLRAVSTFRAKQRVPILSWVSPAGASITRGAQPMTGLMFARSVHDEEYLEQIRLANDAAKPLHILDCRPFVNSVANCAVQGGWESASYYTGCRVAFLDIANIHSVRDSFLKMRSTFGSCRFPGAQPSAVLLGVAKSAWYDHISSVLQGVAQVVRRVGGAHESVFVHCSDAWDRTSQLCALAQLCLDPYYRTMHGFARLIEKDWLTVGHKFSDRLRGDSLQLGAHPPKADQVSPIFFQFIECVWQLTQQYPFAFEFGETFLIDLYDEAMIGRFGTFLYNSDRDRDRHHVLQHTQSLWLYLLSFPERYRNPFYDGSDCNCVCDGDGDSDSDSDGNSSPLPPRPSSAPSSATVSSISAPATTAAATAAAAVGVVAGAENALRQQLQLPKAASTRLPSRDAGTLGLDPAPDEPRQLVARTPVSQETILGAGMGGRDDSTSPDTAAPAGAGGSVDSGVIMPHYQPHNLHIWYGFFQRFSQGVSSLVPDTGVATGDAFVLTLSKRITAMEKEIRMLKRQQQQQQQQQQQCFQADGNGGQGRGQCSASAEMLASLDLRTKSPLSAVGGARTAVLPL